MQSQVKKIIFTDNNCDKAITGQIVQEDDFFVVIQKYDKLYRIGKKSIVCIEEGVQR